LLETVRETIQTHSLLEKGDGVVVGVSGGPDSIALLDLLYRLKDVYSITLYPAHLNHGFRGREAEEDLVFCRRICGQYGLTLISESVDVPALIQRERRSAQALAREVRYDFFFRTAKRCGAGRIALGHHADDQAETLLMRLLRGAGLRGLSGIPIQRPPGIIRPLLMVSRKEILEYLAERKISFREDSSNLKEIYLRNRVRKELTPLLIRKYNPNLVRDLGKTAEILREEEDYLQKIARAHFAPVPVPGGVSLDLHPLAGFHRALVRRIIRLAIAECLGGLSGISFSHIEAVMSLMSVPGSSGRVDLPRGLKVRKIYDRLEFGMGGEKESPPGRERLRVPGREKLSRFGVEVISEIIPVEEFRGTCRKQEAALDFDKCFLPLSVRAREEGDLFFPAGFGKRKKLKRFLIDEKIPAPLRGRIPLFVDREDRILWVGGVRMDHRFIMTDETSRVLLLRMVPLNGRNHEVTR